MSDRMLASQFISLYDLCVLIREVVGDNFPEYIWVVAEIASIKENQNGHCYLELVDKNEEKVIAQARATIWAYNYRSLAHKFEKATGETLKSCLLYTSSFLAVPIVAGAIGLLSLLLRYPFFMIVKNIRLDMVW